MNPPSTSEPAVYPSISSVLGAGAAIIKPMSNRSSRRTSLEIPPVGRERSVSEDAVPELNLEKVENLNNAKLGQFCSTGSLSSGSITVYRKKRSVRSDNAFQAADLFNNECVDMMQNLQHRNSDRDSRTSSCELNPCTIIKFPVVDWSKQKNRQRLKDLGKLIKKLFWAFEVEQQADTSERPTDLPRWRQTARHIVEHEAFSFFFFWLTLYALFGPDLALLAGHSPHNETASPMAIFSTLVFLLFVVEQILHGMAMPAYPCSVRFWIDTFATCSIIGDTFVGSELIQSDAAVAGRGSRLVRLVRVGGRSTRVLRILRSARFVQVVRLIPQIQAWTERSTRDLAYLLWKKRMQHIYQYLDVGGRGELPSADFEFFEAALNVEFPPPEKDTHTKPSLFGRMKSACESVKSHAEINLRSNASFDNDANSLDGCMGLLSRTPAGKRSLQRCLQDISCMKESCAMVEAATSRLTLKVAILVLSLLLMMQLLEEAVEDYTRVQGLHQLDGLARDMSSSPTDEFCAILRDWSSTVSGSSALLFLAFRGVVFWSDDCHCCGFDRREVRTDSELTDMANRIMRGTGLEAHELTMDQLPGDPWTFAIFDTHSFMRDYAGLNLLFTFSVVVLLMTLIFYFSTDIKKLSNSNVLHPLWDLLDDMCALKCIEILMEHSFIDQDRVSLLSQTAKTLRCRCVAHRIPVADEMVQLRSALDKLHVAMCSWSKYVPLSLLKQLLEHEVEAKVGCSRCEVSVVFSDIKQFKEICENMAPHETLSLLNVVLRTIYDCIEDNGGTLLEFIGDEILAVFNAPVQVAGHSNNAVKAMLESIEKVSDLSSQHSVRLQCSVHKGTVLCGNIGSPMRMKYGVLGDGVNLSARLKSLNTRYDTELLVSTDVMESDGAHDLFLVRPIGKLILKGRTKPTLTYEVVGQHATAAPSTVEGVQAYQAAFDQYLGRQFVKARAGFVTAAGLLANPLAALEKHAVPDDAEVADAVSQHFIELCDQYIKSPPPDTWDGSEALKKKAW